MKARAYGEHGVRGTLPYREAFSEAVAAARRALEIDATLSDAHTALAWSLLSLDWDWAAAERGLKRALELNPNSALAHNRRGTYLLLVGTAEEGLAHERAVELDPLSAWTRSGLAFGYAYAWRFDEALEVARLAKELAGGDPGSGSSFMEGYILVELGSFEESIAAFRQALEATPGNAHALGHLGNAYGRAGRPAEARECLRELRESLGEDAVGTYEVALLQVGLGEIDPAFDWLDEAYTARDKGLLYLKVDPPLAPLRSDRRFDDLLRRMAFPE